MKIEESIKERNKIILALLILSKNKRFNSLVEDKKLEVVAEINKIGEEIADGIVLETGEVDPRKITEKLGVKVLGVERGFLKRSEYRFKQRQIVIFRDALERLTLEIAEPNLSEKILRFLIAYELFKHLEYTKVGFIYKRFKFPLKLWFGFYIKELSEVAAMSFVLKLLSLSLSPSVFDYIIYMLFPST